MTEQEALQEIRDVFGSVTYLLMEKYGNGTRSAEISNHISAAAYWEDNLKERARTADYYDYEIETSADFIPKNTVPANEVFGPISRMTPTAQNARDVINAKKVMKEWEKNDFQHNY